MPSGFQRLGSGSPLHKTVQEEIRHYIIRQGLRPGQPLKPEAELARLFGVSRNSVREAVKALESIGVLETRRGSGVFVKDFSFAPLLDNLPYGLMQGRRALSELLALRKTLESAMIGDAMRALTPASETALREVLAAMRQRAEAGLGFEDQDREFHRQLFADLGNEMLLQLFDLFWVAYHRAAPAAPHRHPAEIHRSHALILQAVLSGDPDRGREAIRQHYVGIEERIGESAP
ncbi:FadR/GntR family transcriptional regulator [Streptomyces sp. SBT349]|uniref:FadR/GntR family transcriptional regulator n=1 Tax=Streptomyces sp. SBT349 TaxID=1580539 RepID=UPI00066A13B7|nr:FadR/GntR family transcriptional regulator [Streptomyces sp. SBT349]